MTRIQNSCVISQTLKLLTCLTTKVDLRKPTFHFRHLKLRQPRCISLFIYDDWQEDAPSEQYEIFKFKNQYFKKKMII